MNLKILTVYFLLIAMCSYGQQKFAIKVYQNTDLFEATYNEQRTDQLTKYNYLNFHRISVALAITSKNDLIHELEILMPEITKPTDDIQYPMNYAFRKDITFDSKASSYSFRYEVSKSLTAQSARFAFDLGLGINPYYVHIEYVPKVEATYYWSAKLYGMVFNIIPSVKYRLSNRFSIDLNMPLKIYDLRGERNQVDNPAIPKRQQTTKDVDNVFFEQAYTIRLGLMYDLSSHKRHRSPGS